MIEYQDFAQQIDHDGPQHIDGAAPPPSRSEGPVFRDGGELALPVGNVSKVMPPQDVMDAAMLLTEACSTWTPAPLPKPSVNGLPQPPIFHNPSYVLHQDLCTLATDPVGFNEKMDDVFAYGMVASVLLILAFYLLLRLGNWVRRRFSRRKERSAEALKARLIVETAKAKADDINLRQAPRAAQ